MEIRRGGWLFLVSKIREIRGYRSLLPSDFFLLADSSDGSLPASITSAFCFLTISH
jgi:hypothetical protein